MSAKFIYSIAINLRLLFKGTVDIGFVGFLTANFHSLTNPGPLLTLMLDECYGFPPLIDSLHYLRSWKKGNLRALLLSPYT